MNRTNKNSLPDYITCELVLNGGKNLVAAINILIQASYQLGYFLKPWKKENKIYLKKPEKSSYHFLSSYRSIYLTNNFNKIFERVILQEAINTLTGNNFFGKNEKNVYAYQKRKKVPQALLEFAK